MARLNCVDAPAYCPRAKRPTRRKSRRGSSAWVFARSSTIFIASPPRACWAARSRAGARAPGRSANIRSIVARHLRAEQQGRVEATDHGLHAPEDDPLGRGGALRGRLV